ncbi:hypothetical protein QCD58_004550 [Enterobacter hormaechei]|nr:hypothetical protein [Enterobacter hormaechei]
MILDYTKIKELEYSYYTDDFKNESFTIDIFDINEWNFSVLVKFNCIEKLNVPLLLIERLFQYVGYIIVNNHLKESDVFFKRVFIESSSWECFKHIGPSRTHVVHGFFRVNKTNNKKSIFEFEASIERRVNYKANILCFF